MVGRQALMLMLEADVSLSRVDAHGLSVTSASEPPVLTPHLTAKHTEPVVTTASLASTASTVLKIHVSSTKTITPTPTRV